MLSTAEYIVAVSDKPAWLLGLGTLALGTAAVGSLISAHHAKRNAANSELTRANTELIAKQFVNNGGTTARDAVDRIEEAVMRLEHGHQELHEGQDVIRKEIATLNRRQSRLEADQAEVVDAITAPIKKTPASRKKAS